MGAKINTQEELQKFSWDDDGQREISQKEVDELQALIDATNQRLSTENRENNTDEEKD